MRANTLRLEAIPAPPDAGLWLDAPPRKRALRAGLLAACSLGLLWWLAARRVLRMAQVARCEAPDDAHLLIPGQGMDEGELGSSYARRLQRALLLWRHRPRRLLLAGSADDADSPSEALVGLEWLIDSGLPTHATVALDETDCETVDQLRRAHQRFAPGERVAIVSNRYHLARCAWIARALGLDWSLCAAETQWRGGLDCQAAVAREALELLALGGWRAAIFDAPPSTTPH